MSYDDDVIRRFRENDGEVQGFGRGLVILHHIGARSGAERESPVLGIPIENGWTIAASKGGAPEHPAWYGNLLAHPDVEVEAPGEGTVQVRARVLEGAERQAAWQRFLDRGDSFRDYEARAGGRIIPVIALERR